MGGHAVLKATGHRNDTIALSAGHQMLLLLLLLLLL
jgi:hypothetical protein